MGETQDNDLKPSDLVLGKTYKWRYRYDKLTYIGKKGIWHRFTKIGDPRPVFCEVLDADICMFEVTK